MGNIFVARGLKMFISDNSHICSVISRNGQVTFVEKKQTVLNILNKRTRK